MIGKQPENIRNNADANTCVLAVAQDILYSTSNSCCKTQKHIGIAIAMHHVARSRQILDMLHSQGDALSYDDVCRIESATATSVLSSIAQEGGGFIPSNISRGTFTHAAMDNIDINEETRSGQGTTHVLGSLLYQDTAVLSGIMGPRFKTADIRSKAVDNLTCLDMQECPNRFKKQGQIGHLKSMVDILK